MATIDEIAKRAKVSKTTVSFVLNSKPGVGRATAEHVRRVMAEMNYVPSALAQRFASSRSMAVALIALPYSQVFSTSHHADVLDAVFRTLDADGYTLVLATSNDRFIEEQKHLNLLRSGQVDGLLLLEPTLDQEFLADLAVGSSPAVIINADGEPAGLDYVRTDDLEVGRMAARHLLELGHRNIGFIVGSMNHSSARDRYKSFSETLAESGYPLEEQRVYHGHYDSSAWSGQEGCRVILESRPETTAIFCCNDTMAAGAISAAQRMGRHVPRSVSIIGVDDNPICGFTRPQMTSIRQPSRKIAETATKALIKRLTDEGPHRRLAKIIPPELLPRESTAPPES